MDINLLILLKLYKLITLIFCLNICEIISTLIYYLRVKILLLPKSFYANICTGSTINNVDGQYLKSLAGKINST